MGIGLLPFCGIVFLYQGMAERYTYVASVGLALLVVMLVELKTILLGLVRPP